MAMNFESVKRKLKRIRPVIVIGWVVFVCLCYIYYYARYLYNSYPILHRVRELGIWEMVRRYFTP